MPQTIHAYSLSHFDGLLQLASPFIATRVNVSLIFAYSEITILMVKQ